MHAYLQGAALLSLDSLASSYLIDPPTTAAPDTIQDCSDWLVVEAADSCESIAETFPITVAQFKTYNPSVGANCNLIKGNSYCVEQNWGIPPPVTTVSSSTIRTPTNGITTPTPIQSGMTENCSRFYLVVKDDGCYDIAAKFSISLQQFYAWNPFIGNNCQQLWPDTYVCVGLIGSTPTPTATLTSTVLPSSTKTTPTNGINTPTPIQPSMVPNCDEFYRVKSGDSCWDISAKYGITLGQFGTWNPYVGSTCANLWPDYYVCVSIVGVNPSFSSTKMVTSTTKPSTTTTKPGNGIATPTPIQSGMIGTCRKFYKVKSGDGCWGIANDNKIDLNNFYKWNPAVKTDCSALWPDYYVCVGI